MTLRVISPKKRSTRLSHEAEVGVKCKMKALLAGEPSLDSGMLVRGVIVADDMDLFIRSDGGIDFLQEGQPFAVTMPVGRMCQHFAAQVVQRGKESHRPVPVVIMGAGADMAYVRAAGRSGCAQSLALALLVSSTRPRRFAEGSNKGPTTSQYFSSNSRSLDNLKPASGAAQCRARQSR